MLHICFLLTKGKVNVSHITKHGYIVVVAQILI